MAKTRWGREWLDQEGAHGWELVSVMSHRQGWKVQAGVVQIGVEIAWTFIAAHGEVRVRIKRLEEGPAQIRRVSIVCKIDGKAAGY